jgi:hypothetical protein
VKAERTVAEHHVVTAGDGDDERAAGDSQQGQQVVEVVLDGLGVVGMADVHRHRQAQQLAAEVVLQAGAEDLLAVVQVLGPDEADGPTVLREGDAEATVGLLRPRNGL